VGGEEGNRRRTAVAVRWERGGKGFKREKKRGEVAAIQPNFLRKKGERRVIRKEKNDRA